MNAIQLIGGRFLPFEIGVKRLSGRNFSLWPFSLREEKGTRFRIYRNDENVWIVWNGKNWFLAHVRFEMLKAVRVDDIFFFMNFMKNMVAKLKYAWSTTAAAAAILYRNETNVRARRTKRREETGQRMQAVSEWAHRVTDYVSRLCFSKNVH